MKKILLFLCTILILVSCKPDEIIVDLRENPSISQLPHDPNNGDPNNPPAAMLTFDKRGDVFYNPDLGYLSFPNAEIYVQDGLVLDYVGIKIFNNGREVNPKSYWMFEIKNGHIRVWYRPAQMELDPNDPIVGNSIGIQIFGFRQGGDRMELMGQEDNIEIRRP